MRQRVPVGQVCSNGTCALSCQQGLVDCNGTCINPNTSDVFCGASGDCTGGNAGATCASGQLCSAGTCGLTCQQGLLDCGGTCVDPKTSNTFCGATLDCKGQNGGAVCAPGQVCSGGTCQLSCQQGLVNCNGTCVDPNTSNQFCGASGACTGQTAGQTCPSGQVCSIGKCQVSCQVGLLDCGGTCSNPLTDPNHCGATADCNGANAGAVCAPGQVCSGGTCQLSCQQGLVDCNGVCVDPSTSNQFCGASGACTGPTAGQTCAPGQLCSNGSCQVSCQQGLLNCSGICTNPQTDPNHCGATADCAGANGGVKCAAGQVCSGGTCQLSCQQGLVDCNGTCVDPKTSNQFCGATGSCTGASAGQTCPPGQLCSNATCQVSCQAGLLNCGGICSNPQTDPNHCGATLDCTGANTGAKCAAGQVCSGGICQLSCQQGLVDCNGVCIDPNTSDQFCGASGDCQGGNAGQTCQAGQVCSTGACQLSCQQGLLNCGGLCTNPQTDPNHCGATTDCAGGNAGAQCASGQVCSGGTCQLSCQQGLLDCNGSCVDPSTDRNHCGASGACTGGTSGAVCGNGQICQGGACTVSCPGTEINCGGVCVDPATDRNHCGASGDCTGGNSGAVCGNGLVCTGGACVATCFPPLTSCGQACVNLETDPSNCGSCGNVCGPGLCGGGTCPSMLVTIPVAQLDNLGNTCSNGIFDFTNCNPGTLYGFHWTDPLGAMPSRIDLQIDSGFNCEPTGTARPFNLNGTAAGSFTPVARQCGCAALSFVQTFTLSQVASYVPNGVNQIQITGATDCAGLGKQSNGSFANIFLYP